MNECVSVTRQWQCKVVVEVIERLRVNVVNASERLGDDCLFLAAEASSPPDTIPP